MPAPPPPPSVTSSEEFAGRNATAVGWGALAYQSNIHLFSAGSGTVSKSLKQRALIVSFSIKMISRCSRRLS